MNKNCYRVVYSQVRGMFVAVAETVKSRSKAAGQSNVNHGVDLNKEKDLSKITYKKLIPLNFSIVSILGAVIYAVPMSTIGNTQIFADKTAPNLQQATILKSSNGLTQVNIQTPSAGGVSRNTYKQFDVGQEGAILNNSRNNVQTQIGGWVQGNPWLAKGEAKVILNEVNSSNPSQLKGYLEVAGKSAQVVIANPSGLVCDGCGVINADRFTLTTGQSVMNQGYLESFRVREGQVTIEGKGLNGSLTPYTDVYARAFKLNAGLYANELNTVLGQNDIQVNNSTAAQVSAVSTTIQTQDQPNYALDVGQLGGMYAGKIFLVGTEQGLGVRNAGSIHTTIGQMTLNANGDLANTGNIVANKGEILIQAHHVENSGNISSTQSKIEIDTKALQNKGLIATSDELKLNIQGNLNNNDGVMNAGRIDLVAQELSNKKGKIEQTGLQNLNISSKNLNNNQGIIGQAAKEAASTDNQTGTVNPPVVNPEKNSSAQDGGVIKVAPVDILTPKQFAVGQIQITQDIENIAGQIVSNAEIHLKVQDNIQNNEGEIQLPELAFNGQNFENREGLITAKLVNITAQNIDNRKGVIDAIESLDLYAQHLKNKEGRLQSATSLRLSSDEIDNKKGQILARDNLIVHSKKMSNEEGVLASVHANTHLNINNINNNNGEINAGKAIELIAKNISNQKGVIVGETLQVSSEQLDNTDGTLYSKDRLNLDIKNSLNNHLGTIAANQQLKIQAERLDNTTGKIVSEKNQLDLKVQSTLNNQSGEIYAGTQADISANILNNQQGAVSVEQQLGLTAGQLNNKQGQISSHGSAHLNIQGKIDNQEGVLIARQNFQVQSQNLNNKKGVVSSEKENVIIHTPDALINHEGNIYAGQNVDLVTGGIVNQIGQISAKNQLKIQTQQQQLNNQQGKMIAQEIDLKTGLLDNQSGLIQAEKTVQIDTQNHALLNKNSGNQVGILSQGNLELKNISELDNTSGYIAAGGSANITTQNLDNNKGQINSQKDLNIRQQSINGRLDNLAGKIQAHENVNLNVDTVNNSSIGSHIIAGEKLTVNSQKILNEQTKDSTVIGGLDANNIEINTNDLDNQDGTIRASHNATLNIQNQLSNQSGSISSFNSLNIGTPNKTLNVNNIDGELLAKNQLNIKANTLTNKGEIISDGNVDIALKESYTHTQDDQIIANGTLKLNSENDLINQSELTAGQKLELKAKKIRNESGATLSSNQTYLIAEQTLHNQGLINGELTHIQADRLWNDGARIYGTHVAIQANTLDNLSNSAGTGAVIASRGNMDLGVKVLNNHSGGNIKENARDNAWIFSTGDLNIGGRLNENLQAEGQADTINNLSARIESLQDLALTATHTNNINQDFQTEIVQVGEVENKVYIQPEGKTTKIPQGNLVWRNWSRAGLYRYDTTPDTILENVVLGETPIPQVESVNCVGEGDEEACHVNYKKDDSVWAYFKITPPSKDAPEAPNLVEPVAPEGQASCEVGVGYDAVACTAYRTAFTQYENDQALYEKTLEQYKKDLEAWGEADESAYQALSDAIETYNQRFNNSEFKNWMQYEVKESNFESQVSRSAVAEIVAGGDINLFGDGFKNDKSIVLAGGKLNAQLEKNVEQIDGEGVAILKQTGTSQYSYSKWRGGVKRYYQRRWGDKGAYNPADEVTKIDLPVNQWLGNVKNHTTNQSIGNVASGKIQTNIVSGEAPDQLIDRQNQNSSVDFTENENAGQIDKSKIKNQSEIRSISIDFIHLPSNALFNTSAESQAKYLVETDPAFSNYKNWLSSDYMLDAMELDPATKQKRLGDGYYEQRLVQDQIAQLTGRRFLQGYANDEAQYKALMNNGLSFAQMYNLRPGIALTAAQIAQLTTDIVWLEEKTVTLADGTTTKALVPQVYVKVRAGDLKGDGTLISAEQVKIDVKGNVINSATIAGREAIQISADTIDQLGGRMQTNRINLETKKDFNNIGGTIRAFESGQINVGGNFNHASTTQQTMNQVGESEFSRVGLDRKAGIYVGGLNPINSNDPSSNRTLDIRVGGDTTLKGAEIINSNGSTIIKTEGKLDIGHIQTKEVNSSILDENNYNKEEQRKDIGSTIKGLGNVILSANSIEGKAVNLDSEQGDVALLAKENIDLKNGENYQALDQSYLTKHKGLLGSTTKLTQIQSQTEQSLANQMNAGGNIVIRSEQGNIDATHLIGEAGKQIVIHANNGNVDLRSAVDSDMFSKDTAQKGPIKYTNTQSGYSKQTAAQTQLQAGENVDINAGKNITLQANDISGNSIYIGNTLMKKQADGSLKAADGSVMPENVTITTLETENKEWNEKQSGYRGIAKALVKTVAVGAASLGINTKIKVGETSSDKTESTQQQITRLNAAQVAVGSSGQTKLTSTDIDTKTLILSGQKVILDSSQETMTHTSSRGEETIQGLGVKLNQDNLRIGGFKTEETTQSTKTTEITHKAGSIKTENLKIQGADGIDIYNTKIKATGETLFDHGRGDLNADGYENTKTTENKQHSETHSVEVGVRNAFVDAALAVKAFKEAVEALKQSKDQHSQAERDYSAGKITKQALEDSKVNVAMATANLVSAEIAVGSAAAGAAASSATYGFTIGANGERIETTTTTTTSQGKWQGSDIDLNHLTLKSEGQDFNIRGSRLNVSGNTTFDGTKDVNVFAGLENNRQESSTKTNNQSVSYSSGGGGSVSIGKQNSDSKSESQAHVNSEVNLNQTTGSINKLNIQGGEVIIADRGDLKVNQIHVESLQDTATSSNSSQGGSIGGGTTGNITASYNQGKGNSASAWVNNTSKLLIGNAENDADLDAMGVKNITNIGGVIANASKQEDGTLKDHGKLNYTGQIEVKDLKDFSTQSNRGFNISTSIGQSVKGQDADSVKFPNGSTTVGLQSTGNEKEQLTKATIGQGQILNITETTNRDINNTQEITRDQVTGMLDGSVTVDHRLLTETGRAQIIQEQKDLPQNAEIIGKMTAAGVTSLGVATASLATGDQNLKKAYDTVMTPARTFDFVQKHPEAATVIEQFKNGDYDGLLATKGSIQLLAQALGQDVDVLTASITSFLGMKGAFDRQTNTVVLDVTNGSRSELVNTFGHEIAHGQGIQNETSADLVGKSVDWAFNSGIKNNQDTIDQFKGQLGDGKDLNTQTQNQEILKKDNEQFINALSDHPDAIEEKTSYKQSIANSLFCWNKECTEKFKQLDQVQEIAYRKGQDQAVNKFIDDIKNLPNVPKELYEALRDDPYGTTIAILKGIVGIPEELWDTGKTITKVNLVGDKVTDFEKMGNAEMTAVLYGLSAAVSAGTVTVVKKGGTITLEAVKDIKRVLQNDPSKLPPVKVSSTGNISAKQITENGKIIDPPKEVLSKQKELFDNPNHSQTGALREQISDSYFVNSGFTKLESKCGSNCFDGVYMKNGELYIVEVKPLKERGSVKLSDNKNSPNSIGVQMSNEWIISRANELTRSTDAQTVATGRAIIKATREGKPVNKIVVGVNDSRAVTLNLGNKVEIK